MQSFFKKTITVLVTFLLSVNITFSEIHHRVKIHLNGNDIREISALGLAMDVSDHKPGIFIIGEYSESELKLVSEAGFHYDILIEDMSSYYIERNAKFDRDELNRQMRLEKSEREYQTPVNFTLGSMGGFHTYTELLADLDDMHTLFPELISERQSIAELNTIENRPVYWVRISNNPNETQDKPKVLYTALTHAREPASMQQMLFQMWYILENYDSDPEIQYLVDNVEMYFVPCVNPDGYIYCETTHPNGGSMHRKNMRVNSNGSLGVDLNRNFGYMWGYDNVGSSPNPSAQTYRGTAPFSEPETQLQKIFAETFDFSLALNNHTFSDLLIYPWGYSSGQTPDNDIFVEYAKVMTRENNYVYGTCYETLGYFANGVSDDWFYGEQVTKEKVFAFTPEAGAPSDGFWPAMNRIEEICAGHTQMNLSLARLALSYAEVKLANGPFINQQNHEVEFEIINLGQNSPADFTVSIIPLNYAIQSTGEPVSFQYMDVLQSETGSISLNLIPELNPGAEIKFVLSLSNGDFDWNDTIVKYFGQPEVLFFDPCDNMDNWTSNSWGVSNTVYYSAPGSIADSPGSNYPNNANTHATLNQPFDLSNSVVAWVEFQTRYDIELNWDYVQFMYSIDGQQTWVPLKGKYTQTGGSNQDTGQPLYHGTQIQWVEETVDLSHLTGQPEVWFRFRLISDAWINREGFYFDDFTVYSLEQSEGFFFFPPESVSFYQHEETTIDFTEFISWELDSEIFELDWEDNENFEIEIIDIAKVSIRNSDIYWTGEENILFMITENNLEFSEVIAVESKPVPAPIITGQEEATVVPGGSFYFQPSYLFVEDAFFQYPEDFDIILFEGEEYNIVAGNIIEPESDFLGNLIVPVLVNNGFQDSEVFEMEITVAPETAIHETENEINLVYYDRVNNQLIIRFEPTVLNESFVLTINDITGRVLERKTLIAESSMSYNMSAYRKGVYVVTLKGPLHIGAKILIY